MNVRCLGLFASLLLVACSTPRGGSLLSESGVDLAGEAARVGEVLDDWHRAAAEADQARYLGHFAPGAVFVGTDASERWSLEEFSEYVGDYFPQGGWEYIPHGRHVTLAAGGTVAWFDEQLAHAGYGELRGTGVLRRMDGAWRIEFYAMGFTVPNDVASEVVKLIRSR